MYGAAQCYPLVGGCQGAAYSTGSANNCYPHAMWSKNKDGSNGYPAHLYLDSGGLGIPYTHPVTTGFSVRCVLDLDFKFISNTDGCQGSYNNYCYPNVVWSSTSSNGPHRRGYLNSGTFTLPSSADSDSYARGVRCVLGLAYSSQLCDQQASSSYSAAQCRDLLDGCQGARGNTCYPYWVWSGQTNGGNSGIGWLSSGTFTTGNYSLVYAGGVRCVPDLKYLDLNPADGCQGATNTNCYPNIVWGVNGSSIYEAKLNSGTFSVQSSSKGYAQSVRCVLDLAYYSCASFMRVLSTALRGAYTGLAAVRALTIPTATRTLCGPEVQAALTAILTTHRWIVGVLA